MSKDAIPISVIKKFFADGAPIEMIRGKFTKLHKGHAGENTKGPYRIQNGTWQDESGDTIDVQIKDQDEDWGQNYLNTPLEICAYQGDRKLTGLYAYDDEYKGKTTRKIKITKTAEVNWLRGGGQQSRQESRRDDRDEERAQRPRERQQDYDTRDRDGRDDSRNLADREPRRQERHWEPDPPARHEDAPADHYKDAMKELMRMTVLYSKCYDAAASIAWRNYEQHHHITVSGAIGGLATSLFIEANKKGLHAKMPLIPLSDLPPVKGKKVGELMDLLQEAIEARKGSNQVIAPAEGWTAKPPEGQGRPAAFQTPGGVDDDEIPF